MKPALFAVGDELVDQTMSVPVRVVEVLDESHPQTGERLYRVDSIRNPASRPGRRIQERMLRTPR